METLLILFSSGIAVGMAWALYCNNKAYSQRIALINAVFHEPDGSFSIDSDVYRKLFHAVTYEQHYKYLLLFRDPLNLYDNRLLDRLKAQGGKSDG